MKILSSFMGMALALGLASCSLDMVKINPQRVEAARKAADPTQRGPGAPGYFKHDWTFSPVTGGYLFDPSKLEMQEGAAVLRPLKEGGYPRESGGALLQTVQGRSYLVLDGFEEILGASPQGQVKYQLSPDGVRWFYYDGKQWVSASPSTMAANTAAEIKPAIVKFHEQAGEGSLYVKAFVFSVSGKEPVALKSFSVTGVAPQFDEPGHSH